MSVIYPTEHFEKGEKLKKGFIVARVSVRSLARCCGWGY
jgi:hypothetical protein